MSGRFKVITALMCDDVRHEVGDTVSLMGVTTPGMECTSFPARRRLNPVLIVDTLEVGPTTFRVEIKWRGKVRYGIEVEVEIDEVAKGIALPVRGTVGNFDRPGILSLDVILDEKRRTVQKWTVGSAGTPASTVN